MKTFVTGAAGFIGSTVVDRLLAEGYEVVGYDNLSTGQSPFMENALKNSRYKFINADLLDTFTLEDNIYLPLVLAGMPYKKMHDRLVPIAERLGISALLKKYPYEVSGGQKQRAAAARALITNPKLILADEPTGALDSKASDELLSLFSEINRTGQTIVMVTHSVKAASTAGRVLFIRDGEVFHQIYRGNDTDEQLYQKISDTLTLLATGGDRR